MRIFAQAYSEARQTTQEPRIRSDFTPWRTSTQDGLENPPDVWGVAEVSRYGDILTAGARAELLVMQPGNSLRDKPHRAIGDAEVRAAGCVIAAEGHDKRPVAWLRWIVVSVQRGMAACVVSVGEERGAVNALQADVFAYHQRVAGAVGDMPPVYFLLIRIAKEKPVGQFVIMVIRRS